MNLTPVDSSNVAAIGYLDDERILLVRYRDGSLYAQPQVLPSEYAELLAAPSKGRWMACHEQRANAVLIARGSPSPVYHPPAVATPDAAPLNVIDEDADKCCRRQLSSYLGGEHKTEPFECSACGTQLYPERIGANVYWRIKSNVAIVRRR